jgi:cytoskeletal protein CcmA (bactofilin family)
MITVSAGTIMRGNLVTSGAIRLDGRFDGRIICGKLEITRDGYVNGSIAAREVIVSGQVVGRVEARSVVLTDGAFVEGDIRYASIALESGATMTGKAIRADANYSPPDLLSLEADMDVVTAQLDQMEETARHEMAARAEAEYPAYERVRRSLVAVR